MLARLPSLAVGRNGGGLRVRTGLTFVLRCWCVSPASPARTPTALKEEQPWSPWRDEVLKSAEVLS